MSNRWAIIDDNGVIDEDTEDEIKGLWDEMFASHEFPPFTGDLLLVEIHGRHH